MRALLVATLLLGGCTTAAQREKSPPMRAGGPNWDEVDKTVQRVKAQAAPKFQAVETARTVESGYFPMTDEEYAAALEAARTAVRKETPDLSDADVEAEATKRADEAKRRQESTFTQRASSTYEIRRP